MENSLLRNLPLVDVGGHFILLVIVLCLVTSVVTNLLLRSRYAAIRRDLKRHGGSESFSHPLLSRVVRDAKDAHARRGRDANTQGIVEHAFQIELRGLLLGERYVRSSTGLVIILGLVGTFYGLSMSIGKLVNLVSSDVSGVADITEALTRGLTEALSGMSVAFTSSLFGIASAIVMTLFGIVSNVTDQRTATMVELEAYLDRLLSGEPAAGEASIAGAGVPRDGTDRLAVIVSAFGQSVGRLEGAVERFDASLQGFATTTRDFREFNLHLKDNVQRMSLSFGDFSEAMKTQIGALKSRDGR